MGKKSRDNDSTTNVAETLASATTTTSRSYSASLLLLLISFEFHSTEGDEDRDDLFAGAPVQPAEAIKPTTQPTQGLSEAAKVRLLPMHNVEKVMRSAIPQEFQLSRWTKLLMQEAASEFISFVASEAADPKLGCTGVMSCEDVLRALNSLGFEHMVSPLSQYTAQCRQVLNLSKRALKRSVAKRGEVATDEPSLKH
eukprot:m.97784 g.97784  ORF g.97784 m.97784 type:complete len:197 (-) comp13110_c0_seq16:231-821(-)